MPFVKTNMFNGARLLNRTLYVRSMTGFMFGAILFGIFYLFPPVIFTILLMIIFRIIAFTEWPLLCPRGSFFKVCCWTLFYVILPFFCLFSINHDPLMRPYLGYFFICIFAHDTGAYISGTLWGKHLLLPLISPAKTWEGVLGGFCATLITVLMLHKVLHKELFVLHNLLLSIVITIGATAGDMVESWLKRRAQVKDSGFLLPGHGGLLDRFDSVLFLIIIFYLYLKT